MGLFVDHGMADCSGLLPMQQEWVVFLNLKAANITLGMMLCHGVTLVFECFAHESVENAHQFSWHAPHVYPLCVPTSWSVICCIGLCFFVRSNLNAGRWKLSNMKFLLFLLSIACAGTEFDIAAPGSFRSPAASGPLLDIWGSKTITALITMLLWRQLFTYCLFIDFWHLHTLGEKGKAMLRSKAASSNCFATHAPVYLLTVPCLYFKYEHDSMESECVWHFKVHVRCRRVGWSLPDTYPVRRMSWYEVALVLLHSVAYQPLLSMLVIAGPTARSVGATTSECSYSWKQWPLHLCGAWIACER